jgi:hypothetical protein
MLQEKVTGNLVRQLSSVTIRKLDRPNSHLGGTTLRRSKKNLTGPGSGKSCPVSQQLGYHNLQDKRDLIPKVATDARSTFRFKYPLLHLLISAVLHIFLKIKT